MDADVKNRIAELEQRILKLEAVPNQQSSGKIYATEDREPRELPDRVRSLEVGEEMMIEKFIKFQVEMESKIESHLVAMEKLVEWINEGDARERDVLREFAKQHLHYHVELDDQVARAFFKTHPDVVDTLAKCDTIIGMRMSPKPASEDHHEFIERIFDKNWDGRPKPNA
jgi:hypothetical protein